MYERSKRIGPPRRQERQGRTRRRTVRKNNSVLVLPWRSWRLGGPILFSAQVAQGVPAQVGEQAAGEDAGDVDEQKRRGLAGRHVAAERHLDEQVQDEDEQQ